MKRSEQLPADPAAEELESLRAEIARLERALAARREPSPDHLVARPRRMMESDPDLPGLRGLWQGEGGLAWQLFVQGAVTIISVLAVVGGISIIT